MSTKTRILEYEILDVFTETPFSGNPLAIVWIPRDAEDISQTQKQRIAKEFNLSETVFLHYRAPPQNDPSISVVIDIFDTTSELPFAGHPTIGAGWRLLESLPGRESILLRTKAGDVPVIRDCGSKGKVRLQVPVDYKFHGLYQDTLVKASSHLTTRDFVNGREGPEPVASVVKGMTFMLLELTSEEALAGFVPTSQKFSAGKEFLGEWEGFTAVYLYVFLPDGSIRTRMFEGSIEDPATGSAASTLAVYLATKKGEGKWTFSVVQGVEIGRRSEIEVYVELDKDTRVLNLGLVGEAVKVMNGRINV
ncbi:hypothetical protein V5O48_005642 [Marasmius crinis-equi]|uniref:Uncharacterized protein n=1 Tax=Marasmius crinis-equi TaxID=585013 RepID=A0ABR3FLS5_9AGAR